VAVGGLRRRRPTRGRRRNAIRQGASKEFHPAHGLIPECIAAVHAASRTDDVVDARDPSMLAVMELAAQWRAPTPLPHHRRSGVGKE
jgi:hypothetical protein